MCNECDICAELALDYIETNPYIERSKILIDDVDFSIRTYNVLKNAGIRYLNDLAEFTSRTLLQWRTLGKKSLNEIRETLAIYGLSLKDETVDIDVKKTILIDLPKVLRDIKKQVDEMQQELRFFGYKIDQIATYSEKTKQKIVL